MKDMLNIHTADQQMHSVLIVISEDRKLANKLHNQAQAKNAIVDWANSISYAYSMAVYSFNTARYEDVKSDVKRCKLTANDVQIILSKMVEIGALDLVIAQIWVERITGAALAN